MLFCFAPFCPPPSSYCLATPLVSRLIYLSSYHSYLVGSLILFRRCISRSLYNCMHCIRSLGWLFSFSPWFLTSLNTASWLVVSISSELLLHHNMVVFSNYNKNNSITFDLQTPEILMKSWNGLDACNLTLTTKHSHV